MEPKADLTACPADPLISDAAEGKTPAYAAVGTSCPASTSTAVAGAKPPSSPPFSLPPDNTPPLPPLVVPEPSLITRVLLGILRLSDTTLPWYRLPSVLGIALLAARRVVLQRLALLPVGGEPAPPPPTGGGPPPAPPQTVPYRTDDGSGNDPHSLYAGAHGVYFGRNCPAVPVGERDVHNPPPRLVADRLLTRRPSGPSGVTYKNAGDQMSVVGAAWIQFMVHSWLRHIPEQGFGGILPAGGAHDGGGADAGTRSSDGSDGGEGGYSGGVGGTCPLKSFTFKRSLEEGVGPAGEAGGFRTCRTMWWDGSALYGQTAAEVAAGRTGVGGEVRVGVDGTGDVRAGDQANSWVGMAVLQELFGMEHNAVVRMVASRYPGKYDDEQLFRIGRLVVSAVIAKIHTIDWTVRGRAALELGIFTSVWRAVHDSVWSGPRRQVAPAYSILTLSLLVLSSFLHALSMWRSPLLFLHRPPWQVELLKTKTLHLSMNANWSGLLGAAFKDRFGHLGRSPNVFSGLVGARTTENHGVPYSLTEEFTAVYRLHPMLPDSLPISVDGGSATPLTQLLGRAGEATLAAAGAPAIWTAMGTTPTGALSLFNYPAALRAVVPTDDDGKPRTDRPVDLAALDVYRDRERGVLRYNAFRRALHLPPLRQWEDLTSDQEALDELRAVYGDEASGGLERLDLLVGHLAEDKIPGFILPQPAFLIFIVMASRRLESDAAFNTHFTEEVYTPEGMAWVRNVSGLRDVLERHMPAVAAAVGTADSAFSRWGSLPGQRV